MVASTILGVYRIRSWRCEVTQPIMVGVYEDEYVLTDAGWRFARRASIPTFVTRED